MIGNYNFGNEFRSPQIEIYSRWYGHLTTEGGTYWNEETNQHWSGEKSVGEKDFYYLLPNIVLSFYPSISREMERLSKIYFGGEILNTNHRINAATRRNKFKNLNYTFGFVVNDQLNENCFLMRSDSEDYVVPFVDDEGPESNKYKGYYFSDRDPNSEQRNSEKAYFYGVKPFKIKYSCFQANRWNKIRIWWNSNDAEANLDGEIAALEIFFRFLPRATIHIDLKNQINQLIKNPYVFWIQTNQENAFERQPQVFPIAWQVIEVKNLLKEIYDDAAEVEKFFSITDRGLNVPTIDDPKKYWLDVFKCLSFQLFQKDFEHFRKNVNFLVERANLVMNHQQMKELEIELKEKGVNPEQKTEMTFLPIDMFEKATTATKSTMNGMDSYLLWKIAEKTMEYGPKVGWRWNQPQQIWEENWVQAQITLAPSQAIQEKTSLVADLEVSAIWNLNLIIHNQIMTNNDSFRLLHIVLENEKEKETTESQQEETKTQYIWIVSHQMMKNLHFTPWTEINDFEWELIEKKV